VSATPDAESHRERDPDADRTASATPDAEPTVSATPDADRVVSTSDILDSTAAGGKVIRGSALRSGAYAAGILIGLLATPLMVRHLGVVEFGRYVTVSSLIFIVNGLTEAGLFAISLREYSQRDGAGREQLMRDMFGLRAVLNTLGAVLAIGFALAAGYPRELVYGTMIASTGLISMGLYGNYTLPLSAELRLGWIAGLEIIRQAFTAIAIVALVVLGSHLGPFLAINGVAAIVAIPIASRICGPAVRMRFSYDRDRWWALLRDSIPYAAAAAVAVLYFRIGAVLMTVVSSDDQTGYYGLAFRIIEIVSAIPLLLVSSALPILSRAARDDAERLRYALGRLFEVAVIAGVAVAIATAFGAPFAVRLIGGADAAPAAHALALLGVAMIGSFLVATYSYALLTLRRHRALLFANLSAFAVSVTLTLVLAPPHGAVGGALAVIGGELWLASVYLVVLVRTAPELRPPVKVIGPVVVAAALAIGPLLALDLPSLAAAPIATAIYIVALWVMRAIPQEIFEQLRRNPVAAEERTP
jgi:O-antigen/teichoic acid export membrane protein